MSLTGSVDCQEVSTGVLSSIWQSPSNWMHMTLPDASLFPAMIKETVWQNSELLMLRHSYVFHEWFCLLNIHLSRVAGRHMSRRETLATRAIIDNIALSSASVVPYVLQQPVGSDMGAVKPKIVSASSDKRSRRLVSNNTNKNYPQINSSRSNQIFCT